MQATNPNAIANSDRPEDESDHDGIAEHIPLGIIQRNSDHTGLHVSGGVRQHLRGHVPM